MVLADLSCPGRHHGHDEGGGRSIRPVQDTPRHPATVARHHCQWLPARHPPLVLSGTEVVPERGVEVGEGGEEETGQEEVRQGGDPVAEPGHRVLPEADPQAPQDHHQEHCH